MSDVSALRAVRAHFGLSQAALAGWLGLSRSLLALVETGREQLPRHARPWLRPWEEALALPDPGPAPVPFPIWPPPPAEAPAAVLARLRECEYQARLLHRRHAALLTAQRTAARRLAAAPLLLAALPPPPAPEAPPEAEALRRRWLARLLEAATDALLPTEATGPTAALLRAARLGAWLHEAALLRAGLASAAGAAAVPK